MTRGLGLGRGSGKASGGSSEVVGRRDAAWRGGEDPPAGTHLAGDGRGEQGILGGMFRALVTQRAVWPEF